MLTFNLIILSHYVVHLIRTIYILNTKVSVLPLRWLFLTGVIEVLFPSFNIPPHQAFTDSAEVVLVGFP